MNFRIKNSFTKCNQICGKLQIWSHLLKKFLEKNFIFFAVTILNWIKFVKQLGFSVSIWSWRQKHKEKCDIDF